MKLRVFIIALLVSGLLTFISRYDGLGKIRISYEVITEKNNITQLYWTTTGDKNVRHINEPIKRSPESNTVFFKIDATTNKITIVPIITKDKFKLGNIKIYRPGSILELPGLALQKIDLSSASDTQNFLLIKDKAYDYRSLSVNPLFTFNIDSKLIYFKFFVINFLILAMILTAGSLLYNRIKNQNTNNLPGSIRPEVFLTILLLALFCMPRLFGEFHNPFANLRFIVLFTLFFFASYLLLIGASQTKINGIPLVIVALVIYLLLPDISYRFGIIEKKPYSIHYTPQYHWRISNSPQFNLDQSGDLYRNDMNKIRELVTANSSFISDQATSYYALSFLPMYSTVAQAHHGGSGNDDSSPFVSYEFQKYFCSSEKQFAGKSLQEYIKDKTELHRHNNWPTIKYILLNKDTSNRFVRWQCLTGKNQNTVNKVKSISKLVYQGKFIDLYEIDLSS